MLHYILPRSHILFSTTFIDDDCERTETQILYPVIRRVSKERRGLPQGCLVYEPDYSAHSYTYRPGEFSPTGLKLCLPDQTSYKVHLLSAYTTISRYDHGRRNTRMTPPDTERDEFSIFNGPAGDGLLKVFYKRTEDSYKLHAFSIPFLYVLDVIGTE